MATKTLRIDRSATIKVWRNIAINILVVAYSIYQYTHSDRVIWLYWSMLCAVFAFYQVCFYFRRQIVAIINDDGISVNLLWKTVRVNWENVLWTQIPNHSKIGMICHKDTNQKDKYLAISLRMMGEENADILRNAIQDHCPDIPIKNPNIK